MTASFLFMHSQARWKIIKSPILIYQIGYDSSCAQGHIQKTKKYIHHFISTCCGVFPGTSIHFLSEYMLLRFLYPAVLLNYRIQLETILQDG